MALTGRPANPGPRSQAAPPALIGSGQARVGEQPAQSQGPDGVPPNCAPRSCRFRPRDRARPTSRGGGAPGNHPSTHRVADIGRAPARRDRPRHRDRQGICHRGAPRSAPSSGEVRFSEVEVELAEGSSLEILEAVVEKLQESGARPTSGGSKLATVLQLSAGPKAARKRRQGHLMADLLQQQAGSCLDTLLDHDPAIRAEDDDPEHIHRTRVATRRLRTVLRGFEPVVSGTPGDSPRLGS